MINASYLLTTLPIIGVSSFLSTADFLLIGIEIDGFGDDCTQGTCVTTYLRRFHSMVGVTPKSGSKYFSYFQTTGY